MRYSENRSVETVLAWLTEKGCPVSRRSYQEFNSRVLRLLSLDHAKELGVEVGLLRAIRVRYKLLIDPKRTNGVTRKSAPWHNSRVKRRKIGLPRKPKSALGPAAVQNVLRQQLRTDSGQLSLLGIEAGPSTHVPQHLIGDPAKPETLRFNDWKIINDQARAKLAKQSRHIFTNDAGTVFHLITRKQYTEEGLIAEFGLTLAEAQSCFLTLDT